MRSYSILSSLIAFQICSTYTLARCGVSWMVTSKHLISSFSCGLTLSRVSAIGIRVPETFFCRYWLCIPNMLHLGISLLVFHLGFTIFPLIYLAGAKVNSPHVDHGVLVKDAHLSQGPQLYQY